MLAESVAPATRIQINGVVGEKFQLALTEEPKELAFGEEAAVGLSDDGIATMLVEDNGKRYQVSVKLSEISDRLLISKDLEAEARQGTLDQLFLRKQPKLQNLPNLVGDYEKLFENHFAKNPGDVVGQLSTRGGTVLEGGLNARQMMKIVRAFHRAELLSSTPEGQDITFDDVRDKYGIQTVRVLYHREAGDLKMSRYDVEDYLGEGTYGTAVRIAQLDLNKVMVAKVVRDTGPSATYMDEAKTDLANEFRILRKIHRNGKVAGIQDAPHAYIAINGAAGPYAMVGTEYAGNTKELVKSPAWTNADLPAKLDCCRQILEGGARMEELGLFHLDQKPENVFFRIIQEGGKTRFLVETADFGGASDAGPPANPVFTPDYMPLGEYNRPTHKTDVYQRGVILYYYLTNGQQPWPLTNRVFLPGQWTPSMFPTHSDASKFNEQALIDQNVPEPIRKFIRELCDPDPNKRPNAVDAANRWKALVSA